MPECTPAHLDIHLESELSLLWRLQNDRVSSQISDFSSPEKIFQEKLRCLIWIYKIIRDHPELQAKALSKITEIVAKEDWAALLLGLQQPNKDKEYFWEHYRVKTLELLTNYLKSNL